MPILQTQISQTGLADVVPNVAYIATNDTIAQVTTAGYLNILAQSGYQLSEAMMALVSTKTTPSATSTQVSWFDISFSGGNWSLVASSSTSPLPNGQIFVGNASGVATAVAMSGDATIANTGALTIAANAITTAKILNANVTLAKLASGIAPSHVIKFANQVTTVGGAAAEAFTVTGAVAATDRAFVQVVNDGTANVTVLQAVVTNNTLTVTFSADPGADTVINYQIIRAAS